MRKLITVLAMAGALAAGLVALPAVVETQPAVAHGKMHCNEAGSDAASFYRAIDPIVSPGVDPFGHEHAFFGNTDISVNQENSTFANMVGGPTTCSNSGDSAIYWVPAVYQRTSTNPLTYTKMKFNAFIAYYRPWRFGITSGDQSADTPTSINYPEDLRMIAGDPTSVDPQSTDIIQWNCNQNSSKPGPYTSLAAADCSTATGSVVRGGFHIDFPTCYSGTLNQKTGPGNTADFTGRSGDGVTDQVAYPTGTSGSPTCPAGFSGNGRFPALRMSVSLLNPNGTDYQGDGTDVFTSLKAGADGIMGNGDDSSITARQSQHGMHGDFFNSWVTNQAGDSDLAGMRAICINTNNASHHTSGADQAVCGD